MIPPSLLEATLSEAHLNAFMYKSYIALFIVVIEFATYVLAIRLSKCLYD